MYLNPSSLFYNYNIENFKRYKNIAEFSREVILSLKYEMIVYKNKNIKKNSKFKDKKMMSIIGTY